MTQQKRQKSGSSPVEEQAMNDQNHKSDKSDPNPTRATDGAVAGRRQIFNAGALGAAAAFLGAVAVACGSDDDTGPTATGGKGGSGGEANEG
jgi:hypothetical protein